MADYTSPLNGLYLTSSSPVVSAGRYTLAEPWLWVLIQFWGFLKCQDPQWPFRAALQMKAQASLCISEQVAMDRKLSELKTNVEGGLN